MLSSNNAGGRAICALGCAQKTSRRIEFGDGNSKFKLRG
jgi:hypothetical protein